MNVAAIENFVVKRNDNFNFRGRHLQSGGSGLLIRSRAREIRDIANAWGSC